MLNLYIRGDTKFTYRNVITKVCDYVIHARAFFNSITVVSTGYRGVDYEAVHYAYFKDFSIIDYNLNRCFGTSTYKRNPQAVTDAKIVILFYNGQESTDYEVLKQCIDERKETFVYLTKFPCGTSECKEANVTVLNNVKELMKHV